jgi:hypothetical protein
MKPLDWADILLHCIGAMMIVAVALFFAAPWLSLLNIGWFVRELWQHRPDWHEPFVQRQSLLEWAAPSAIGMIGFLVT